MEQTTLQERIEERAKESLLKDLYDCVQKEVDIRNTLGERFTPQLKMYSTYPYHSNKAKYDMANDFTKELFNQLLPIYIKYVTDDILRRVDEIGELVSEKKQKEIEY